MRPASEAHRTNNFDAIRLVAALTVIVAHAWPLTGTEDQPRFAGILVSHLGVYAFFSVSGYLIARSWNSSPHPAGFLVRRATRIFPALIVVIVLSTAVIGPVLSTLSAAEYFRDPATVEYLRGLVLAPTYSLPGVFESNPTSAVNGSLWSIGPEFACYLVVLAVGLLAAAITADRRRARSVAFALVAVASGSAFWLVDEKAVHDASAGIVFFMVGAILGQYIERLPLWPIVPALVVLALSGLLSRDVAVSVAWLVLPYVVLSLALRSTPGVRRAGRFGDFSYGLYLWGFPVQQVVYSMWPDLPLAVNVLAVVLIAGALAAASWFIVERRCIDLGSQLRTRLAPRRTGDRTAELSVADRP